MPDSFPIFVTSPVRLRPLLSLKEFVGDIAIRFRTDGISVTGKTMESQVVYELSIAGEVRNARPSTGEEEAEEEVVVGVEPSLLETSTKHIGKNKRVFLTAYEARSEVTGEMVLCLRLETEDRTHTTDFGPIDSPAMRLAPTAFARATHYMCPRKLSEAVNAAKSTRTDAVYVHIAAGTTYLRVEARGCNRTTKNDVAIFDDPEMTQAHVFGEDEVMSSYYAFMVVRGLCNIAPAGSVRQLRFGTDGALLFFSISYVGEDVEGGGAGTRFDALVAPIPEEYVRPASKRKLTTASVQAPAPKRAFYKNEDEE